MRKNEKKDYSSFFLSREFHTDMIFINVACMASVSLF